MSQFALAACLLPSLLATGCQSMGTTARGQSPEPESEVVQAGHRSAHEKRTPPHHPYHQPLRAGASAFADHYHGHHSGTTTYFQEGGFGHGLGPGHGHHGAPCPPDLLTGHPCPPGHFPDGICPPGHVGHPWHHGHLGHHGHHGHGHFGNELDHFPRQGFTYSYEHRRDLVYPPPNATGGAVVYPYYTHKGPSDFFRAH